MDPIENAVADGVFSMEVPCSVIVQDLSTYRAKLNVDPTGVRRQLPSGDAGGLASQIVVMGMTADEAAFFVAGRRYRLTITPVEEEAAAPDA